MFRNGLLTFTGVICLSSSGPLLADTGEPPLLVAPSGVDTGNCQTAPCESLSYALQRVGKNGQISVSPGNYALDRPEDVVYLLSGAIDVRAETGASLVGVPADYAGELQKKGFRVLVDSKGLSRERASANAAIVSTQQQVLSSVAAVDCVAGQAGTFPCLNVDLLGHVPDRADSVRGADIWGFMDLNTHREYVIMGYGNGTAIYDVTDPENPAEVGFIPGQSTTWRDIKVQQQWNASTGRYDAFAFITADGVSDGLRIMDLRMLPHAISQSAYNSDISQAHNVFITDVEYATGLSTADVSPLLIAAGSELSDGRFRAYDMSVPQAPATIGSPSTPAGQPANDRLYMHDAAFFQVTDSRANTQCPNANNDHCDILFDFNEDSVDVWDVTDPGDFTRLSNTPYTNSRYVHSGWPTEDGQYLFVQDELDERDLGLQTTLRVFDISNLAAPTLAGTWTGPTTAIDHNGFVRGNRYYMSNYARGLTILDITNPASPALAGRFDTYPSSDSVGFPGAWGTYPFLPSGNVAISDIDSGLYMVRDNTLSVPEGSLGFTGASFGADESQTLTLEVQRSGGTQGAVSVGWELIRATADGSDVTDTFGTLNWTDGDAASKTISIGLSDDGVSEGLERAIVRLISPTGGATLSSPAIASAWIADPGATATLDFDTDRFAVTERGFGTAVAVVRRTGSAAGAVSVDFAVTAGDATAGADYSGPSSGTLNWASGDATPKWIEYPLSDDGSGEPDEFFEITLSNVSGASLGTNASVRVDLIDGDGANSEPNAVAGTSQTVSGGARVTLDGSGSNDPNGDTLTYAWTQTVGPAVTLTDADTSSASFTAPTVSSSTMLRFELAVSDPSGLSDTAVATVTVSAPTTTGGGDDSGGGSTPLWMLALLSGLVARRAIRTGVRG